MKRELKGQILKPQNDNDVAHPPQAKNSKATACFWRVKVARWPKLMQSLITYNTVYMKTLQYSIIHTQSVSHIQTPQSKYHVLLMTHDNVRLINHGGRTWKRKCLVRFVYYECIHKWNKCEESKVIWQKATSPSCHSSRRRMHSSVVYAGQAHSPVAAGKRGEIISCVVTLQWAGTCPH